MGELLAKYFSIYALSMLKFIAGPLAGLANGTGVLETSLFTVMGMMTSVLIFSFLGKLIKEKVLSRIFKKKKKFTAKNRRFISLWNKYGMFGVSFLTPVIFSPIGGTILITSINGFQQKGKLFGYMLLSASFWALTLTLIIHQAKFF